MKIKNVLLAIIASLGFTNAATADSAIATSTTAVQGYDLVSYPCTAVVLVAIQLIVVPQGCQDGIGGEHRGHQITNVKADLGRLLHW